MLYSLPEKLPRGFGTQVLACEGEAFQGNSLKGPQTQTGRTGRDRPPPQASEVAMASLYTGGRSLPALVCFKSPLFGGPLASLGMLL